MWFRRHIAREDVGLLFWGGTDSDADFNGVDDADPEVELAAYAREITLADQAAAGRRLDEVFFHPLWKVEIDVRWVYVHMIEEYVGTTGMPTCCVSRSTA